MVITVSDNFAEAAKLLDQIARKAGNTVGLMRQFTGIMHDEVEQNFAKEGRPTKWHPLAPSTTRRRKAKGTWPGKILQVRGRLATAWSPKYDNNTAMYGTNVAYAAIQNFGGTTKHAARERVLHFSQKTRGKMTHGRPGNDADGNARTDRFAKAGKAHYSMKVQGKAFSSTIPARSFLYIGPGGIQEMISAAKSWLMGVKV